MCAGALVILINSTGSTFFFRSAALVREYHVRKSLKSGMEKHSWFDSTTIRQHELVNSFSIPVWAATRTISSLCEIVKHAVQVYLLPETLNTSGKKNFNTERISRNNS